MGSEVDLLLPELGKELLASAWQLHTHALHPVAQLWADSLYNGNGATLVQVNLQYNSGQYQDVPAGRLQQGKGDLTKRQAQA